MNCQHFPCWRIPSHLRLVESDDESQAVRELCHDCDEGAPDMAELADRARERLAEEAGW